jgi:hypothetical protein
MVTQGSLSPPRMRSWYRATPTTRHAERYEIRSFITANKARADGLRSPSM